ncbi:exodeoxyribonuclease VII large subunit [Phormidium sp. CCY1219]|uniref:exodeoxyribonuclease VII large subunit n=1 Tax=Phormidium sp. CCY1219 TaxID=2886104 RepID=UPI002D1E4CD9|nr:exodeoxyribonuclease VII large subunit [Phormidium sp. CCY1219]MEB3830860.1 exodeoxyribonuclease VII large subunit [Phormidium sp. CCY1219]
MMDAIADNLMLDNALSVAGLSAYIKDLLELDKQLRQVWVMGEVSSARSHRSGLFFTLQEPDGSAAIRCVVWGSQLQKLVQVPEIGEQVLVLASIRLYPKRGDYQLNVWQAFPAGEGLQALRYRQLRSRLEAEGLFHPDRKRPLPPHPQTLAVVTSPQAAAWGDIQRTLRQRYPGLRVLLSPATVQGEQAPASIARAIARVEGDDRAELLILARGGGASEDLACFNDEGVVRAIACCSIPVITGIGHQRDESLADLVADVCAHTPTAAAEMAVPELASLSAQHQQRVVALKAAGLARFEREAEALHMLRSRLGRLPLSQHLQQHRQALHWQEKRLVQVTSEQLRNARMHCQMLRHTLHNLDPQRVLQRGYAVVRTESGAIARSSAQLAPGEALSLQLGEGRVKVQITEILE